MIKDAIGFVLPALRCCVCAGGLYVVLFVSSPLVASNGDYSRDGLVFILATAVLVLAVAASQAAQ